MRKVLSVFIAVMLAVGMGGCGNQGVSQEEYDKVVAERGELQEQLDSLRENPTEGENDVSKEDTSKEESESDNTEEKRDDGENKAEVEILAEYTLSDGIGWYTRHFIIIKNNSSETVDISTSSLAYSEDGTMVSAADGYLDALGAGCASVLYEAFETESDIDHYDTTMNASKSEHYKSVIQDLSYVQNDIDGGAVFQVTNNAEEAARFVEGYALFFSEDKLVGYADSYFTDDDSELKPGKTISKQLDCHKDYDRIEFYLTGRR